MNLLTTLIFFMVLSVSTATLPAEIVDSLFKLLTRQTFVCQAETTVKENQVLLYFTSRTHPDKTLVTLQNYSSLINPSKCTKFIIHGYLQNTDTTWVKNMASSFNTNEDCQVIQVDWRTPARQVYPISAQNTRVVGQTIANFVKTAQILLSKVHIVGHSLGAHVAGFAAKALQTPQQKPGRVSGLDPAGPCFSGNPSQDRLNSHDADFVDITHTNGGVFGYIDSFTAVDFFPNGGSFQPGCPNVIIRSPTDIQSIPEELTMSVVACDHCKSIEYFTNSINKVNVYATKCTNYYNFLMETCSRNNKILYGEYILLDTINGDYFWTTVSLLSNLLGAIFRL